MKTPRPVTRKNSRAATDPREEKTTPEPSPTGFYVRVTPEGKKEYFSPFSYEWKLWRAWQEDGKDADAELSWWDTWCEPVQGT